MTQKMIRKRASYHNALNKTSDIQSCKLRLLQLCLFVSSALRLCNQRWRWLPIPVGKGQVTAHLRTSPGTE